jgi:hypothetical protein
MSNNAGKTVKKIRIGGGQGFWGDSSDAAIYMTRHDSLDYMGCDYLAELTMSIMARQKLKNPQAGYATDFIALMKEIAKEARDKKMKVLTNAGGMNISGCVDGLKQIVETQKIPDYKIGYVSGDDLSGDIDRLMAEGVKFTNIDDTGNFEDIHGKIINANVYFGAEPTVECLEMGADVVITGRSTDSALFLAPLKKEFGWKDDDWNNLARGIMTGHLLECGGQCAGGNFDYGWREVPCMSELGFPVAELSDDSMVITKTPGSGGVISEQSCKEQFLYEIHDPGNYVTPDVIVDISQATLTQEGKDRVVVGGIRGKIHPDTLKLSIGYLAGYKAAAMLSFSWPDAYEKAQYAADILMKKMRRKGLKAEEIRTDYIGLNALHLDVADLSRAEDINEVVLRFAVRAATKEEAQKIIPEIAPLQLNGPPGASFFGGRSKVQEVIGLWPCLIPRDAVKLEAHIVEIK